MGGPGAPVGGAAVMAGACIVASAARVPETGAQALIHVSQDPIASGRAHAPPAHPGVPLPAGKRVGSVISLAEEWAVCAICTALCASHVPGVGSCSCFIPGT